MARYTPGQVSDPEIARELLKIAQAMETQDETLSLKTLYAAPKKYREGTLIKADGTSFNPGSGAGVYCRRGAAWTFLG
jgi:hypothetical protein